MSQKNLFKSIRILGLIFGVGCLLGFEQSVSLARAADWPTYRGGSERHGFVQDSIADRYVLLWVHTPRATPRPAWPAPARRSYWQRLENISSRVNDDATFQPVIANGRVYFGSSADDHLYCLSAASGKQLWSFCSDGPIRFAPFVTDDGVYFGSDDGKLYCLNPRNGKVRWSQRIAEEDRRIPGNGRLISAWPVRTGCVVQNGSVFVTAGLFPQQGAWAASLNAASGDLNWKQPLDVSPQGYLLASEEMLYVPTGRGNPVALDLSTGEFRKKFDGVGGAFAVVSDGALLAGRGNDGTLEVSDATSGERMVQIKGTQLAITAQTSVFYDEPNLTVVDRKKHFQLNRAIQQLNAEMGSVNRQLKSLKPDNTTSHSLRTRAVELAQQLDETKGQLLDCLLLKTEMGPCTSMVASNQKVIMGRSGAIDIYDVSNGSRVFTHEVDAAVWGLSFSNGRLYAVDDRGRILCFGEQSESLTVDHPTDVNEPVETVQPKKFGLIIGIPPGQLLQTLAEQRETQWTIIEPGEPPIQLLRELCQRKGIYGSRIVAHSIQAGPLPFTHYIFNEIRLMAGSETLYPKSELRRLLRPHGGKLVSHDGVVLHERGGLPGEGKWTHLYGNPGNSSHSGDVWTDDDLKLQWFGGPGPRRMVDRHLRGPAPLYENGVMIIPGENVLIGVDPYHGGELWQMDLPPSQRYSMPYDAGYMSLSNGSLAIAVHDACWMVDAYSGKRMKVVSLPGDSDRKHWGYVVLHDDHLIGSIQKDSASRTVPGYAQIDQDYRNGQPIVTSESLFRLDPKTGHVLWQYEGGLVLNPTLTISESTLFFVENQGSQSMENPTGRIALENCLANGGEIVALSLATGEVMWRQPVSDSLMRSRNIVYLSTWKDRLVICGSFLNDQSDSTYFVACLDADQGRVLWEASHDKGKPGESFHGEQLHHPVIMEPYLITEPVIYQLSDGKQVNTHDTSRPWTLQRPGHSCGTLSAGGDCLFFRATNPTALDLSENLQNGDLPTKLSPSRTGCWINIIPAGGLVLIPEASAGCVCHFSLQTSMGFLPSTHWK